MHSGEANCVRKNVERLGFLKGISDLLDGTDGMACWCQPFLLSNFLDNRRGVLSRHAQEGKPVNTRPIRSLAPKHHRRRGFTLIELLVVIAIIALLVGILLPALAKARFTARVSVSLNNVRQMGISFLTYSNDQKAWLPILPFGNEAQATAFRRAYNQNGFLDGQYQWGGAAALFNLFQVPSGDVGQPPAQSLRGYVGYKRATPTTNLQTEDEAAVFGNLHPSQLTDAPLNGYLTSFNILYSPNDRLDYWYGTTYTNSPGSPPAMSSARSVTPKAPGAKREVTATNISYMYIAGFKDNDPDIVKPAPMWGDETNGPDYSVAAFYGPVPDNSTGTTANATFAKAQPGFYGPEDNNGTEGGVWVFTDGHAELIKNRIQDVFFEKPTAAKPNVNAQSVNVINPNRSNKTQVLD